MSGPLLDRIDIFVEVPRVEYEKLSAVAAGELSERVRQRVETARRCQTADAPYRRGARFIVQK
jgi:magnesium chelatase family protein